MRQKPYAGARVSSLAWGRCERIGQVDSWAVAPAAEWRNPRVSIIVALPMQNTEANGLPFYPRSIGLEGCT